MRALVGVLREGTDADLAPRRGLADIERLARPGGEVLGVRVQVSGDVDAVDPAVSTALYLVAAEAVTNATRHASGATHITVDVTAFRRQVRLRVRDDGEASTASPAPAGYGLRGMAERVSLLGGTLRAGPDPDRAGASTPRCLWRCARHDRPRPRRRRPGHRQGWAVHDPQRATGDHRRRRGRRRPSGHLAGTFAAPRCVPAGHPHARGRRDGSHPAARRGRHRRSAGCRRHQHLRPRRVRLRHAEGRRPRVPARRRR
ncbi:Two component integral membrane signal transduction histidine kinase [Modestobacter italicus]|uniref:histidine kinase n=1 Tax=Modestobacter italicus (strain DSM 44449 / CECT 9708 / BC 501) TaxID=2732864 RepID=I4F0L8_MODI5|nr:Two component integral membrane signal transduction histidine kinase [Modestobacter marinus]